MHGYALHVYSALLCFALQCHVAALECACGSDYRYFIAPCIRSTCVAAVRQLGREGSALISSQVVATEIMLTAQHELADRVGWRMN